MKLPIYDFGEVAVIQKFHNETEICMRRPCWMTCHVIIQHGRPIQNSLYNFGNIEILDLQQLRQNYDKKVKNWQLWLKWLSSIHFWRQTIGFFWWRDVTWKPRSHLSILSVCIHFWEYWNFWITASSPKLWLESQKLATWLTWPSSIHFWKSLIHRLCLCALSFFQVRPNSLFSVEPVRGLIPPEHVLQLKVTANVDDTVKWVHLFTCWGNS